MMTTVPTGRQFTIAYGDQEAVITERGATLRAYRVGDRDVVVPFGEDELPPIVHGAILLPWPNRLADGRYRFDGVTHQLPVNEPERDTAIHGLVNERAWTCLEHSDSGVDLALDLTPVPGYPFRLAVQVSYRLTADGLTIRLTTTNTGAARAPYGVGFHPWLSPGAASVDDCLLQVDASAWVRPDERLLPAAVEPVPESYDFSTSRRIGTVAVDDGFVAAVRDNPSAGADVDGGRSWVRLAAPDGRTAAVWMDRPLGHWQVCTGDLPWAGSYRRSGVAAEPMSCPANAFVTGDSLAVLDPGATHSVTWGLVLEVAGCDI
ncbi:aldose 1-epimerase family protein [Raineyella fluvialis]|nr:aldose 1-epimerase family protein [Raineyella fluvialis]